MTRVILDSCCWLAWAAGEEKADALRNYMGPDYERLVPAPVTYEVHRVMTIWRWTPEQIKAVLDVLESQVPVAFDGRMALRKPVLKLRGIDGMILATARVYDAVLVTFDRDFGTYPGVNYLEFK